jgi:hypothetical protein
MAFPAVVNTATTSGTTAVTSAVINLPASIVAGNLLVAIHRSAAAGAHGWPAGWTELADSTGDPTDDNTSIAWRKADGAEGATVTVTQGSSKFASLVYQISGAADPTIQPPEISTEAVASSASPNPTTCTPTGGAKDYLWLWLGGWGGEQTSPPASTPTNYTNALGADSGVASTPATNVRVASARRELNAASEDPPLWTISVIDSWIAWTMAVHPVAAGAAVLPPKPTIVTQAPARAASW